MAIGTFDILEVSIRCSMADGSDHVNVWHLLALDAVTQSYAQTLADIEGHFDAAYAQFESYQDDGMSPVDMKVDIIAYIGGKWQLQENLGIVTFGQTHYTPESTGDPLPNRVAAVGLLRTSSGKTLGRKFCSGLTEPGSSGNKLIAAGATAFLDFLDDAIADINLTEATKVLRPVIKSVAQGSFVNILEAAVSTYLGTVKKRRPDIGT